MTNDKNKKEKSPAKVAHDNLSNEVFRDSLGLNTIRKDRGGFGDHLFNAAESRSYQHLSSKEAGDTRKYLRDQNEITKAETGYAGNLDVNDSQVNFAIYQTAMRSLSEAKLGDLEKVVLDNGAKLEFSVPEKLKDFSLRGILDEAKKSGAITEKGLDPSKLTEDQKNAFDMQKAVSDAYKISAAMKFSQYVDLYSQVNATGKEIAKKYAPSK